MDGSPAASAPRGPSSSRLVKKALTGRSREAARRARHNRRPRSRRTGAPASRFPPKIDKSPPTAEARRAQFAQCTGSLPRSAARRAAVRPTRPSWHGHAARADARRRAADRPAVMSTSGLAVLGSPRSWASPAAESPRVPMTHKASPGRPPARSGVRGPAPPIAVIPRTRGAPGGRAIVSPPISGSL